MIDINGYLDRQYSPNYTCVHFVRDVWADLTGHNIDAYVASLHGNPAITTRHGFRRIRNPVTPCLVWLKGAAESHAGIYAHGKILHLREGGAIYQRLCDLAPGFQEIRYYVSADNN